MNKFLSALMILSLTTLSYAQVKEVKRMTHVEAKERIQKSEVFKKVSELKTQGKDLLKDEATKKYVTDVVRKSLGTEIKFEGSQMNNMLKMIEVSPLEVLSELARQTSIVKATASTPAEKAQATKALNLIAKSSHTVESLVKNEVEAKKQEAKVKQIIELSDKVAGLKFGEKSAEFVKKYEKALMEGKSLEEAVKIASEGKFKLEDLVKCE